MTQVDAAVAALRAGEAVVIPTDTVYGLACSPFSQEAVRAMYRVKGREPEKPTALVAADLDTVLELVPELRGRSEAVARALLPGPFTLVVPNPARRFGWLTGTNPEALGVRVPAVEGVGAEVLQRARAVAATSANPAGGRDPRSVDELDPELRRRVAAVVDAGELPGTASTVLDLTGPEPTVLREGAVRAAEALARVEAALSL
jgi:L-threonylcarbamoyladenylate synthase